MSDKRKLLYDQLVKDGYDLGDYNSFSANLEKDGNRRNLYETVVKDGYDVGDYASFSHKLMPSSSQPGSVAAQVIDEYDRYAGNEEHKPSALIGITDRSTPFEPMKGFDGQDVVMPMERHLLPFEGRAKLAAKDAERAANNPKNIYSTYVNNKLKELDADIDRAGKSMSAPSVYGSVYGTAGGGRVPSASEKNKDELDNYNSLVAAKRQLEETNKIIEAAKHSDESFLSAVGRGFADKFFTVGNWDLGISDYVSASKLRDAVEKSERGEALSVGEERILDAAATNMAVQGALSGQLGRGYKAGATTGASIPFMLEMIANPISGAGNAMAKGLLKYGLKRFGRIATSKAAKVAGRLAGDAVAATGMAATTGIGHVMAGAEQRMTGDINPEIKDGEIKYGGRENQARALEAYAKSAADRGIENFSEMFFNAFSGGGKVAKSFIKEYAPVLARLPKTKVGELINSIRNQPMAKELANRTQFHGIIGEHAEEIVGDLLRVPMGEASMEDITNVDKNIDTFLGLAPTSVAFGMLGLGGMAHDNYANKRNLKRFEKGLSEDEKELFSELRERILNGNDEMAKNFIKATLRSPELTPEQKKSYIFGTQELVKEKAAEDVKNDPVLEEVNREEIEANKIDTYRNYKRAERKLGNQVPSDIISALDEDMDVDSFAKEKGLNEQQVSAINEFLDARSSYNDYEHEVNRKRNEAAASAREQATNDVKKLAHEQRGTVIEAKIDGVDGVAHIVGGNISFDEDGVLDKAHSDDTIYYLDEDGNKKMVSAENVSSVLSEIPSNELIETSVQQAIAQFDEQESASLETPDIPAPGKGERIMLDGSNYVIENVDNDMPGNFLAVKLNNIGEIDPLGEIRSISPDEYYDAKEKELWGKSEQEKEVAQEDEPIADSEAKDVEPINMSEKEPENEASPSSEESKVSEEPIEDAEQKKKRVIDSMPKKKDGAIDYDALTPQQQYEYTSVTESMEEAVKDLSEDIAERKNKLGKMESQLPNVTGAKKIKLRDAIREHRAKLDELEAFYKEVVPVKDNDTSDLRNDRDYIEWVAENSDDAKELSDAYNSAKDLASHEQALMPWQKELLGRKINPDSFRRFGDRNHITGGLAKAWLNKNGEEIDTLAQELSAFGVDVSEQDIIDFMLANPGNYVSQISEDMHALSARFSEVASKEVGMPIGGPESTTGKLYLKMKEAQVRLDALTDAQQQEFRDAVNTDTSYSVASSENDMSDAYEDVITEDYVRAYDDAMNERGSEEADEELISKAEEGNPELYYGGFTAEELDEIYSKIENGTERQETDSVEDGIEALSKNVPPTKDGGSEEIDRVPDESSRGENKGIELSGDNSLNSAGDSVYLHSNQPEYENDEVPEPIPQGEHRTEVEENGGLEEAANQLRRRIEEASRNASESKRSGNAQQEVNRSIESQAKDSGLWTPIEKISNIGNPFLSGNENDTYLNRDEGVVYKVNNLMNSGSLPNLFSRIDFHNRFFPETKYELVGFTGFGNGGSVYPIYKQRYIPNAEFASVEEIGDYMQSLGFRQTGEAKYSDGDIIISDLRPRNVLKDADGDIYVVDAEFAEEKNTSPEFAAPQINKGENVLDYATRIAREKEMHDVRQSVDTTPTEKQKEAGNYKKGHLKIDGYDVSIENPKGSERSGKDANGRSWSVTMNNDYGYIRGTEGVDGDQIDVFLSDNPSSGKVFVIDQVKEDGSFDEHKVMYGFDSVEEAREAYLANYSPGWKGLGSITEVSKDEFKKWVDSSKRKTKPFSGYKSVKREEAKSSDVPYSIHPSQYTTKKGKVLDMRLVTFQSELSKEHQRAAKEFAKVEKGWYDAKQGGFMMRSEESAKRLADTILNNKDALSNAQPVSLDDMRRATAPQQANTEKPISEVNNKKGNVSDQAINPSKNRLVTDERYAELRERMRKKLGGQMNIGIDPEILAIGTEMAVYHIEKGAREFKAYAKAMISDLGDAIRPYLKAFYNGARNLPEVEDGGIAIDMTPYEEVRLFDVTNFDKLGVDIIATAENLTRESSVEQEVEIAQERIKKIRSVKKETKKKNVTSQPPSEMGLFDSLFDNKTNNDNGLQRTDAERSEGVSANGNQHEQGLSRGTETGSESEQQGSRGADLGGERTGDAVDRAVRPRLSDTITEKKNTHNNHSERGKDHAPTSVDARIDANIKAIELAKLLFESGEQATEKQMQILRKFSGWGGLGKAFSEGTYYAPNHIAKQLRELLGEEAYQQAVMSANSAYYTPAYVVDTLWDIAEQMGFKGGNILEGSAGIGNILGQMPTQISEQSDIHAIEIDGTSGGILSLLYPDAKVEIQGFEQTRIANGSVDLAITNVPFVTGLRVNDTTGDKDLSKKFHNIHDFCIAKNVRKLREGGLGIFITSNGTLDSSKKLRDWIVNEGGSDFVGAFRMHNKTFGGTGVTSDIIIIRKRVNGKKSAHAIDVRTVSGERVAEYDTGDTRKVKGQLVPIVKQLSMDYNQYFIEHPENMAGEMHFAFEKGDTFRPTSKGLYPKQDKKQEQMLAEFVQSFTAEEFGDKNTDEIDVIDAMPGKKIGEVFVSDGKLYINAIGASQPLEVNANKVKGHTKVECFEAYTAIKEALAEVLEYQTNNEDDKGLKPLLAKLNKAYDDFVATYGHFNKNTAIAFLRNDVDYANMFALEKFEETADAQGHKVQKFGKTDVFSKRVVEKDKEPTPNNVKDGIIASFFKFGRVDVPYIAEQLGQIEEAVKKEIIESGYGFEDPTTRQVEVSYQYLSGNVREKLRQAQENNENGKYDSNIKALQEVVPMDIPAHLIDFALGSSWIEPKMYEEYVKERTEVGVQFTAVGGTWFMNEPYFTNYEKNRAMGVTSEMLGRTVMGHTLIEAAIQNRSITVSTVKKNWDGSTETITDKEATQACAAKIDEIRQDFKEWARQKMQSDAEMSEHMERIYNDTFNNYVPMSIPDDFVPEYFGGASHKFKMRPHQGRAIVRGTMQPLLLAHEVGTGKTFTLISTAMEMRRLGTARKPMIVVQNATVGQFVASAKELYPNAKILTLEEADRSAEGRKNFYAKIRYNDWDMIVVPQSTFEFIPDSEERQMAFVQSKIEEKMLVLEKMKEADPNGKSMITRQAEREIELLEEQLAGLSDESAKKRTAADEKKRAVALQNAEVKAMEMLDRRTDDVENFDDMGIDALLIDEAHEYKHLGFATAMQRGVKGVDPSYSKKSQGVYLKTQAVLEKNNGRNVIFATGTPISNTAAEIWTFMRYLMPADTMEEYGIYYFDDFVRNFGNIQQMLEFTTSGKFKENNRFAGYVNLPELVRIWSGVSDTVLTREAGGVSDKIPEMEGGKAQDLYLPQTRALRSIMKFVKAQLEEYDKMSGKEKKENSHIPLTMYGIAKAASVDARLVQSDAEDDAHSKTNEAVRQTLRSLKETVDYKGTVAIFADNYQNKESGFNLYEDIRSKLISESVPADEIVVIKSGMTVKKKLEIFEKVNRGEIRVILGSTFTLGTGVNIQERLHTLIHLDAPNRPMDYTQRNGRILRQGNLHKAMGKPVRVLRFGVEDSLDVTAYQRLKTKGAIADSIMNGKQMMANSMTNRVLEEEEDVFGDTVAQLSGSEYAMLKNNAEKNVRKYASRKKQWEADQTYIHNAKPRIKAFIKDAEKRIEDNSRYLEAVQSAFPDGKFTEIIIGKHRFASVEAMEDFFKDHNKSVLAEMKQMKDGEIAGEQKRELTIKIGDFSFVVTTNLTRQTVRDGATLFNDVKRKMHYSCPELGIEDIPVRQNLLRNAIEDITHNVITGRDFAERLEAAQRSKKYNEAELEQLLSREGNPFEYEAELEQAQTQYEEFSELMKKELEEKEAKYAKMDADVTAADNLSTADETDELERDGDGEYNDDEVSFENDHISKVLGKSRHTRKRRREFAERERQRMVVRVETLAKKLHLDNVEVVTDASQLEGKKQRAKGFYSKSTGKITIVIPNHVSTFDVEQTLLHEAVAHYGLRQLFGEHFDTFLDNVFNSAEESVRKNISDLSATNGWDTRKATEEYLASLAENTAFENINASWWSKIKSLFLDMLHKIGFENFNGITLTDNELRYILWRSYENLAEPSRYRSILGEVKDIAKRYELNVGNYESSISRMDKASDSSDVMFREDTPSDMTREAYEESLKGQAYKAQEAYQDSMLALKRLQDVIENHSGRKLKGFENAYMDENHLSSKSHYESEVYGEKFFKPMLEAVGALIKEGASYDDVVDYMMAKHGLERNEVFAMRDAENAAAKKYDKEVNALRKKFDEGELSVEEELNELIATRKDYVDSEFEKNRGKDYSGLTALTEAEDYEAAAKDIVSSFENAHDTADLWDKVNKATKESLRKSYESGMMSKATFDKVASQFKYYIPLRGWKEDTAADIYEYFNTETSSVNPVLKFSKGRKSLADDPIAVIGNMAESTILQGNRNLMKQKFMNMAINHKSDLLSVSEAWYVKDPSSGNWVLSYPNIEDGDSPSVIAQKVSDYEERMLEMKKDGNATKSSEGLSIDYRISKQQAKEHAVNVKRNGKDYFVYVNGNPRAAQAVNGLLNPDAENNKLFAGISRVNRQLAANFTTRNPAFVMTNLSRDLIFSTSNVLVKEDLKYSLNYIKNIEKSMRIVAGHLSGKSPNPLFEEFLSNGGETGYTALHNIDQYKRMIKKEMRSITGKSDYMASVKACANFFSTMNRWAEDVSRFNAYMTSREAGRSVMQSISDAKEVTVNFNKKGAGYKTGGVFGVSSGLMRNLFLFFNASVQSLANFTRLAANHKKGFGVLIGGFTTAGFITPMLNGLLISLMGGDDDYYGNLTEWERRNNLCIYAGDGKFIKLPLPIELRAFYGIGEMAYQETIGNGNNGESIAYDAINQIADLLPLNPIANNGDIVTAIMPDVIKPFWQINQNKDFTGKPIYRENDFNKTMPEWTKTYRGTSKVFVDLSEWLNELGGGDKYKSGGYWADWNPAKAEHVLESYFGGMATTIMQTGKTLYAGVESAMNGKKSDNLILRNVPVINRFASDAGDDKSAFSKVNSRYYRLNEEYEDTRKNLKGYIKEASTGDVKYLNKLSELQNSKEYEMFRVFEAYKKQIDKLMKMAKDAPGGVLPQGLEDEMIRLKKEAIEKVEKIQ